MRHQDTSRKGITSVPQNPLLSFVSPAKLTHIVHNDLSFVAIETAANVPQFFDLTLTSMISLLATETRNITVKMLAYRGLIRDLAASILTLTVNKFLSLQLLMISFIH